MPTFVLTINMPNPPDRPGVPIAQTLREVAATVEFQVPIQASYTHKERAGGLNATKATYSYS